MEFDKDMAGVKQLLEKDAWFTEINEAYNQEKQNLLQFDQVNVDETDVRSNKLKQEKTIQSKDTDVTQL